MSWSKGLEVGSNTGATQSGLSNIFRPMIGRWRLTMKGVSSTCLWVSDRCDMSGNESGDMESAELDDRLTDVDCLNGEHRFGLGNVFGVRKTSGI